MRAGVCAVNTHFASPFSLSQLGAVGTGRLSTPETATHSVRERESENGDANSFVLNTEQNRRRTG